MAITIGCKGIVETQVTKELTAKAAGSGDLLVFGTPFMIALMECAACKALEEHLEDGQSSVGTMLNVTHDAATPVGMDVRAEAEVTAVEGRKISFTVTAYDEKGLIGKGTHDRFLIKAESFLAKTYDKL
ncbi:MAG: thioesterase family protein [Eubacteriales bacterium]